jgi:hypothetical protein
VTHTSVFSVAVPAGVAAGSDHDLLHDRVLRVGYGDDLLTVGPYVGIASGECITSIRDGDELGLCR